jgi:spore coat polysaccharide biosynthesis protein SpsF
VTLPAVLRPVVAITQARIGSTRLPRKVLLEAAGEPLLWWHLSRLGRAASVDAVVVATTDEPDSEAIAAIAERAGAAVWRGPLDDVLARFAGAAGLARAATVIRVTSDCPLIDPALIDLAVAEYSATFPECRYVSLDATRYPRGLDCEVFDRAALDIAAAEAIEPYDREHVTPFIRRDHSRFRPRSLAPEAALPSERWCVDTEDDLALVRHVLAAIGDRDFGWRDVLDLLDANPGWRNLNAHVMQKP